MKMFPLVLQPLLIFALICLSKSDPFEYRLYNDLLTDYNPLERPVLNQSQAIHVELGMDLQQIINLDEKNQILELIVWLRYVWKDYKMRWNPEKYGGVKEVRFSKRPKGYPIWTPDVLLYNSVDKTFDATYPSNILVTSDGTVTWIPPGILKISCKIDITWFPFDDQRCFLKFGSWTYHEEQLDLQPADGKYETSLNEYLESGEWIILSAPLERTVKYYECCPEVYPSLTFYLNIRRRTLYYGCNLIMPSLLMSVMSIFGFLLPPGACEKVTLGVFFFSCLILVAASGTFAVLVSNLHFRDSSSHEMGPFVIIPYSGVEVFCDVHAQIRALLLYGLPWLLMMKRPGYNFTRKSVMEAFKTAFGVEGKKQQKNKIKHFVQERVVSPVIQNMASHRQSAADMDSLVWKSLEVYFHESENVDPLVRNILFQLHMLYSELKFITKRMEKEDEASDAAIDWQFAAMVVDRLCLIVFTMYIIISTTLIIFSAPHLAA